MGSEFLVFCQNYHTFDAPKQSCPSGTLISVQKPFSSWGSKECEPYFKKILISHLAVPSGTRYAEEHSVSGVHQCQSRWIYIEASGCFQDQVTQEVRLLQDL